MRNLCGEDVRVYWISFDGKSLVAQTTLAVKNSSSVSINSYRSHRFLVWYSKGRTEEQVQAEAWVNGTKYTVGDTNDIVTIEPGLGFVRHDAPQQALEAIEEAVRACDTRGVVVVAAAALADDAEDKKEGASAAALTTASNTLDESCLSSYATDWLSNRRSELDFEWSVYRNLKAGLTNYNCAAKAAAEAAAALALEAPEAKTVKEGAAKEKEDKAKAKAAAAAEKRAQVAAKALKKANVAEQAAGLLDGDARCVEWAFEANQCAENPSYMLRSCKASCAAFTEKQGAVALVEAAAAATTGGADGDGGESGVCINFDAVVEEGENELGKALRQQGDTATVRRPPKAVVAGAFAPCKKLLQEAQKESLAAGPQSLVAEAQAAAEAETKAAAEANVRVFSTGVKGKGRSGGGLLSWFKPSAAGVGDEEEEEEEVNDSHISGLVLHGADSGKGASSEEMATIHHHKHHRRALPNLLGAGKKLAKCVAEHGLAQDFASVSRETSRVRNAKGKLAEPLRNQTCGDDEVGTVGVPEDTVGFEWVAPVSDDYEGEYDEATGTTGMAAPATTPATAAATVDPSSSSIAATTPTRGGTPRQITQLLNRNNAQVFLIDKFVNEDECNAMIDAATPGLRRSTVNEEGNNQAVSQYRNSQAANVMANWRNKSDPIARVVRRTFAFANDHTGYGLTVDGQVVVYPLFP